MVHGRNSLWHNFTLPFATQKCWMGRSKYQLVFRSQKLCMFGDLNLGEGRERWKCVSEREKFLGKSFSKNCPPPPFYQTVNTSPDHLTTVSPALSFWTPGSPSWSTVHSLQPLPLPCPSLWLLFLTNSNLPYCSQFREHQFWKASLILPHSVRKTEFWIFPWVLITFKIAYLSASLSTQDLVHHCVPMD